MLELYWGCLVGGAIFAIVTVVFGDLLGNALDGMLDFLSIEGPDYLQPMTLVGGITSFGGAGVMLSKYTGFGTLIVILLSLLCAIFLAILIYFFYVKPMENSENSTGFSIRDLTGKIGEVITPVPENGYGEVIIKIGAGNTNQIAASFYNKNIPAGTIVVVIEAREDTLFVTPLKNNY